MKHAHTLGSILSAYTDEELITAAWENVPSIPGSSYKQDCDGRFILRNEYGLLTTYGWEIDHVIPTRLNGPNVPSNVRARHWRGNRSAGGVLGNTILTG